MNRTICTLLLVPSFLGAQAPQLSHRTPAGTAHQMVLIPQGNFWMGMADSTEARIRGQTSTSIGSENLQDNKPMRLINLDAYYIDQYEVTTTLFAAYARAVGGVPLRNPGTMFVIWDGSNPAPGYENHPAPWVTWDEAKGYCGWAGLHLPTEAQWEKAARGTDGRLYPWGNEDWIEGHGEGNRWVTDWARANGWDVLFYMAMREFYHDWPNNENSRDGYAWTAPVGSFPQGASPYGVFDMAGNAIEWTADAYDPAYYASMPSVNPYNDDDAFPFKSFRGGAFNSFASGIHFWTFYRLNMTRDLWAGFRCAGDVSISATSVLPQSWGQVKVQVQAQAQYARRD